MTDNETGAATPAQTSPLPWSIYAGDSKTAILDDNHDCIIDVTANYGTPFDHANAELIVDAVNNIAAVRRERDDLRSMLDNAIRDAATDDTRRRLVAALVALSAMVDQAYDEDFGDIRCMCRPGMKAVSRAKVLHNEDCQVPAAEGVLAAAKGAHGQDVTESAREAAVTFQKLTDGHPTVDAKGGAA
jgi:hypothetical protein